jgi:hypothetical protein
MERTRRELCTPKSMIEPGGGGPKLSKFSDEVLEQVSTV